VLPPKKNIKKEVAVPDAASPPSNSKVAAVAAAPDVATSSGSSGDPKLFEFKFTSKKAGVYDDYEVEGRFHVPLLVEPESGVLSLPPADIINVTGWIKWPMKGPSEETIRTLELGSRIKVGKNELHLGYTWDFSTCFRTASAHLLACPPKVRKLSNILEEPRFRSSC